MKVSTLRISMILCSALALLSVSPGFAATEEVMTNATVVKMVQAKISPDLILLAIANGQPHFDIDSASIGVLVEAGVTTDIIKAMAAKQSAQSFRAAEQQLPFPAVPPVQAQVKSPVQAPSNIHGDDLYGFQLGSVEVEGVGGVMYIRHGGVQPTFGGGLSVGLNKYVGLFGQGGYTPLNDTYCLYTSCATVAAHLVNVTGGLEVMSALYRRVVPFGRFGGGYMRGSTYGSSAGAGVLSFGGGVRTYVTKHFGLTAGLQVFHGVHGGGSFIYLPTVGLFGQSK
jgi:hypothetical protein